MKKLSKIEREIEDKILSAQQQILDFYKSNSNSDYIKLYQIGKTNQTFFDKQYAFMLRYVVVFVKYENNNNTEKLNPEYIQYHNRKFQIIEELNALEYNNRDYLDLTITDDFTEINV